MLQGLKGAGDDNISAPREDVNTMVASVFSPISKVEHTALKRMEKLAVKKKAEKGKKANNISTDDEECVGKRW